jgi:hypothetical protein
MHITRSEALFLYSVLFKGDVKSEFDGSHYDTCEDLMKRLRDYLIEDEEATQAEDEEDDQVYASDDEDDAEAEDDSEEEIIDHDDHVSPDDLVSLPRVKLASMQEELSFESSSDDESVTVTINSSDSDEYFDVSLLKRTDSSIELYNGEEWQTFHVKKFPSKWTKLLTTHSVYLVTNNEEC